MKLSVELAIAVLVEEGMLLKDGEGYLYACHKAVAKSDVREVSGSLVTMTAPNWLAKLGKSSGDSGYNPTKPVQRMMCCYKVALGIPWDDREWDKAQYKRYARSAQKLLDAFNGKDEEAGYWLQDFAKEMKESGLNWVLDTAASRAWDTRSERMV